MGVLLIALGKALLLTLLAEGAVILLLTRSRRWLLVSAAGNLATNPLLNLLLLLVLYFFGSGAVYTLALILLELGAVCFEALLYRWGTDAPPKRCFFTSLAANAVSFGIGLLLRLL